MRRGWHGDLRTVGAPPVAYCYLAQVNRKVGIVRAMARELVAVRDSIFTIEAEMLSTESADHCIAGRAVADRVSTSRADA